MEKTRAELEYELVKLQDRYNGLLKSYQGLLVHNVQIQNELDVARNRSFFWIRQYEKNVDNPKPELIA